MRDDGDAVTFSVRGAGGGPVFRSGLALLALGGAVAGVVAMRGAGGIVPGAGPILLAGLSVDLRWRRRSVFRLSAAGLEKDGKRYPLSGVTEILWGGGSGGYHVSIRHGGDVIPLATRLGPKTARRLCDRVGKVKAVVETSMSCYPAEDLRIPVPRGRIPCAPG